MDELLDVRSARLPLAVIVLLGSMVAGACMESRPRPFPPAVPVLAHRTLLVDGIERTYRLLTPLSFRGAGPAPLVLALHGAGNTGESFVGTTMLDRAARDNGFLVAYPEGTHRSWNAGFCCTGGRGSATQDLRFLELLIDEVARIRRLDAGRVYATGVSNGGIMAYRLGCELAGRIAGVASVAGAMVLDDCRPSRPVSAMEIHGTADPLVPYNGGQVFPRGAATAPAPSSLAVMERWASLNACPAEPETEQTAAVVTTTWTGCAGGTTVRLVAVEGGGHTWFSSGFGDVDGAVDATELIVEFFGLERDDPGR